MTRLLKSKVFAWIAMGLIIAVTGLAFKFCTGWWDFLSIFFAFMTVFCHLMSLYIEKMSRTAANKLEGVAMVCGLLMIVAFVVVYFILH